MAVLCGLLIGYERETQLKAAGLRTHSIVALGSCLMMILSKYGFFDVLSQNSVSLDPSRIAAGIVTAIGFLGAGTIFVQKQEISGLTTAAGIWATVGVGMSIGAGAYIVGITSTIFLIIIQIVLHKNIKWLKIPAAQQIIIQIDSSEAISFLETKLTEEKIKILNIQAKKLENNFINLILYVKFPDSFHLGDMMHLLQDNPHIIAIDI